MPALKAMVEADTGGDPASSLKFTRRSLRYLAQQFAFSISPTTVGRLLRVLGYSTRVNVKRFTGPPHPQRDIQFQYIQDMQRAFQDAGLPVVSVDTKKKELIGNFKNHGACWCRKATEVNAHDFRQDAECRAIPYGIYDLQHNTGHFCVGTSRETSQFAVDAIRYWWRSKGQLRHPDAEELLIEADAGGSNGYRRRLWKRELQQWADDDRLTITVCHFPTGASKWNPVEHRLFSHVSRNWSGIPLRSLETMLHLLRGTITTKGLRVTASKNTRRYSQIAVTDSEMRRLCVEPHDICPSWNYTIHPRE
jgi:hypothetical protein